MPIRRQAKKVKKSFLKRYGLAIFGTIATLGVFVGLIIYLGGQSQDDDPFAPKPVKLPKAKHGKIKVTQDGLVTKDIIKEGTGPQAKTGDHVKVHYTGTLTNGKKFDSSVDRNMPFDFTIGSGVIEGWSLGVATMKVGEKAHFVIDQKYAYGPRGAGRDIPPMATLYFDIELLEIL